MSTTDLTIIRKAHTDFIRAGLYDLWIFVVGGRLVFPLFIRRKQAATLAARRRLLGMNRRRDGKAPAKTIQNRCPVHSPNENSNQILGISREIPEFWV
jgi:hypothetical protein